MGWVAGLTEQGDRDPDKGVTREGMGRDTTHQGHRDNKAKPPEAGSQMQAGHERPYPRVKRRDAFKLRPNDGKPGPEMSTRGWSGDMMIGIVGHPNQHHGRSPAKSKRCEPSSEAARRQGAPFWRTAFTMASGPNCPALPKGAPLSSSHQARFLSRCRDPMSAMSMGPDRERPLLRSPGQITYVAAGAADRGAALQDRCDHDRGPGFRPSRLELYPTRSD